MSGDSVKVAVRVRPFNQREKDRQAKCIIKMDGQMTSIKNPDSNDAPKKFSFDYSYWSHDGYSEQSNGILEPNAGTKYASQRMVFNDLGQGVLDNAFEGYNCSLFAYGQTGSGKSFSMVGYGANRGIVPITCDELFQAMNSNTDPSKRYEVTFSMLEIYNEQVRDLLSKDNPKGGLSVRQNPKLGYFYVQDQKRVPVGSYKEIEQRMEQGTASRTVASTNMNATSSRAHTVVTIVFDQIFKNDAGQERKKSSTMNLVDLAGSERADSTGATGDRLKEGANINKSLSALGNVISALADLSMGKKKVLVPYRDSVLTKLLMNALGGNSKTVMIAALSPADINYDETLSTLRYADRAKKIKNKAVVNENPMDKLVRELREENEKLKQALQGGTISGSSPGMTPEEIEQMKKKMEEEIRAQLMANQEMLGAAEGSGPSWEEKLQIAREETVVGHTDEDRKKREPHLMNLNEDPMLSGVVFHFLKDGDIMIGRKDATPLPDVCLSGLSILKNHAIITLNKGDVEIKPAAQGAKTKVNGAPLTGPTQLAHKDRVLFGSNHLYVFMNPPKPQGSSDDLPKEITWEYAQKEIAQAKGFATGTGAGLTKDQQIAQEQVLEILPMVSEVNAVSEELNKQRTFEVVLISPAAQEGQFGQQKGTKVMVKMKNLLNGNTWLWERGKFMNRRYLIQDMYQKWLDGDDDVAKISKEEDPFWEPTEDVLVGTANVFLQSLAYALDFDDRLAVTDYKGQEEGYLYVNVTPCTQNGKALDEEYFVDNPAELLGKPFHFKVSVRSAEVLKARFSKGVHVKYRVYKDKKLCQTPTIKATLNPEFKHSKVISFPAITQDHLDFFETGSITFMLYGVQEDTILDPKLAKMTTKELRQMDHIQKPATNYQRMSFSHESQSDQSMLKSDYMLLQRKFERLEQKERRMQELCKTWDEKPNNEKQFEPFYRAVSALANSTGTRLKTRVQMLNQNKEDEISLYVFGEDEENLVNEANNNGGVLDYSQVKHATTPDVLALQKKVQNGGQANGHAQKGGQKQGGPKDGSKACVIQ